MGCDIHLWVERKSAEGPWRVVPGPNPMITVYATDLERARHSDRTDEPHTDYVKYLEENLAREEKEPVVRDGGWVWNGRSYDLFAILASVRNGWGFAGMPTGYGFNPVSQPRGVPDDMSDELRTIYNEHKRWGETHGFSYHTLRHLEEYDWEQTTMVRQKVTVPLGDSGVSLVGFSEEETRVVPVTYAQQSAGFYDESIPKLRELANGDPDSVRIVFWFDN